MLWMQVALINAFIPCDKWNTLFFVRVYRCLEIFSNRHIAVSFETSVLKEVCILLYLHNNNTVLILKF